MIGRPRKRDAMTLENDDDLNGLKAIGRICANVLQHMSTAVRPGMKVNPQPYQAPSPTPTPGSSPAKKPASE